MSKLGTLIAIPIALWGVKQLQKQVKDEPAPKPLIKEGFVLGPAAPPIVDIFPKGPIGTVGAVVGPTTGIKHTGPSKPIGADVVIPFFPETAVGADIRFAEEKPFDFGLFPKLDLSGIGKDTFTTGFFNPAFQAGLKK